MDQPLPTGRMQHGYLVLADITGYTSYLAGVELDHAHEILSDLLTTLVEHLRTRLTISKLEGDAVFAYASEDRLPRGETLLELIDCTYAAFRERQEAAHRRTTCVCNACRAIPSLDLKFFAHHGDFIVQEVAGIRELVGTDVNLLHRLTKNHIRQTTGWRAYALFTEPVLEHLGVRPEGLHVQEEELEHLGAVQTLTLDLQPGYAAWRAARRESVSEQEAHMIFRVEAPVPPVTIWEWLNDPAKIIEWSPQRHILPGLRPGGRTGVGARNHCVHGQKEVMLEQVLDWQPFECFTVRMHSHVLLMNFLVTHLITPTDSGARLQVNWRVELIQPLPAFLAAPVGRWLLKFLGTPAEFAALQRCLLLEAARPAEPAA